jgi:hypothetical protein
VKDDVAAKPDFADRRRWRLRAYRLVQYALVQALIVIVCIFVLRERPPEPAPRYLNTEFSLKEGGAERPVTLPHFTSSRFSMNDPPLYTGSFSSRNARGRFSCRASAMASRLPSTAS